MQFTATGTSATLTFESNVGSSQNAGAALDNVRVQALPDGVASAAVPLDWARVGAMLCLLLLLLAAAAVVPGRVRRR